MIYHFIDDDLSALGGAELTLNAIQAPKISSILKTKTMDLESLVFQEEDVLYILGNITQMTHAGLSNLLSSLHKILFVKIEFDYGYCQNRGPICHRHLSNEECNCPNGIVSNLYSLIWRHAQHIFYMSAEQMDMHDKHLDYKVKPPRSVAGSCFDNYTLNKLAECRKNTDRLDRYCVIRGHPGWHSVAKGVQDSIKYAQDKDFQYDLVGSSSHFEMLEILSNYKGMIFLPYIHDTCPRVTIEAKLAGCEVITNERAQHTSEPWWQLNLNEMHEYLADAPNRFWKTIECLSLK